MKYPSIVYTSDKNDEIVIDDDKTRFHTRIEGYSYTVRTNEFERFYMARRDEESLMARFRFYERYFRKQKIVGAIGKKGIIDVPGLSYECYKTVLGLPDSVLVKKQKDGKFSVRNKEEILDIIEFDENLDNCDNPPYPIEPDIMLSDIENNPILLRSVLNELVRNGFFLCDISLLVARGYKSLIPVVVDNKLFPSWFNYKITASEIYINTAANGLRMNKEEYRTYVERYGHSSLSELTDLAFNCNYSDLDTIDEKTSIMARNLLVSAMKNILCIFMQKRYGVIDSFSFSPLSTTQGDFIEKKTNIAYGKLFTMQADSEYCLFEKEGKTVLEVKNTEYKLSSFDREGLIASYDAVKDYLLKNDKNSLYLENILNLMGMPYVSYKFVKYFDFERGTGEDFAKQFKYDDFDCFLYPSGEGYLYSTIDTNEISYDANEHIQILNFRRILRDGCAFVKFDSSYDSTFLFCPGKRKEALLSSLDKVIDTIETVNPFMDFSVISKKDVKKIIFEMLNGTDFLSVWNQFSYEEVDIYEAENLVRLSFYYLVKHVAGDTKEYVRGNHYLTERAQIKDSRNNCTYLLSTRSVFLIKDKKLNALSEDRKLYEMMDSIYEEYFSDSREELIAYEIDYSGKTVGSNLDIDKAYERLCIVTGLSVPDLMKYKLLPDKKKSKISSKLEYIESSFFEDEENKELISSNDMLKNIATRRKAAISGILLEGDGRETSCLYISKKADDSVKRLMNVDMFKCLFREDSARWLFESENRINSTRQHNQDYSIFKIIGENNIAEALAGKNEDSLEDPAFSDTCMSVNKALFKSFEAQLTGDKNSFLYEFYDKDLDLFVAPGRRFNLYRKKGEKTYHFLKGDKDLLVRYMKAVDGILLFEDENKTEKAINVASGLPNIVWLNSLNQILSLPDDIEKGDEKYFACGFGELKKTQDSPYTSSAFYHQLMKEGVYILENCSIIDEPYNYYYKYRKERPYMYDKFSNAMIHIDNCNGLAREYLSPNKAMLDSLFDQFFYILDLPGYEQISIEKLKSFFLDIIDYDKDIIIKMLNYATLHTEMEFMGRLFSLALDTGYSNYIRDLGLDQIVVYLFAFFVLQNYVIAQSKKILNKLD